MPFPMGPGQGEGLRGLLMQILDAAGQLPDQAMGPHAGMMNEGLEEFAGGGARGDDVMGAMPMLPPLGKLFGMAGRLRGAGGAYQGTQPIAGSRGIPHTSELPNPAHPSDLPYAQGRGSEGLAGWRGEPQYAPRGGGGAPPSGGGYADDAAGLMRGDIPLEQPRMGADFQAMDDLGPMAEAPIDRSARMSPGPKYGAGYADDAAYAQRAEPQRVAEIYPYNQGSGFNPDDLLTPTGELTGPGTPYPQGSPWPSKAHPAIEQGPLSRAGWGQGMTESPGNIQMVMDEFAQINASGQVPYEDTIGYLTSKYGDWILDFI